MASTSSNGKFFDDLVRCETRLYNALNDVLREQHGVVTSQYEFLRHLRDHPGSRVADLAATFVVGVGATSKGIDRCERNGWLQRVQNPSDRRSSLLELTDAGRELVDAAEATVSARLAELLAPLAPTRLSAAATALAQLRQDLEAAQVGTPTG